MGALLILGGLYGMTRSERRYQTAGKVAAGIGVGGMLIGAALTSKALNQSALRVSGGSAKFRLKKARQQVAR